MTFRAHAALLGVLVATGLAGCSNSVTSPTPLPTQQVLPSVISNPPFSVADVTLSGVVFEVTPAGRVPIAGVGVSNGEGEYAVTDANGFFSLSPVWICPCSYQPWIEAGVTLLWLWTDDYVDPRGSQRPCSRAE